MNNLNNRSLWLFILPLSLTMTACQKSRSNPNNEEKAPAAQQAPPAASANETDANADSASGREILDAKDAKALGKDAAPSTKKQATAASDKNEADNKVLTEIAPRKVTPDQEAVPQAAKDPKPVEPPKTTPAEKPQKQPAGASPNETSAAPAARAETTLKGPAIKILNSKILNSVDEKEMLALYQNALVTTNRAFRDLYETGQGVYCQTEGSAKLKDQEIYTLVDGNAKEDPKDATLKFSEFKYQSQNGVTFSLHCTSRGQVSNEIFHKNFKSIIAFEELPGSATDETAEQAAANDRKRKSFRIVDMEKMSQIIAKEGISIEAPSIMNGKIVPASDAIAMIYHGAADEVCQISNVKGQLQAKAIYQHTGTKVNGRDDSNRVAMISYQYDVDARDNLTLQCLVRLSTSANEIFKTFQGVLQFGVAK